MSTAPAAAAAAVDHTHPEGNTDMYLIHEELARSHAVALQRDAEVQRLAVRVAVARRWARRAEAASRRARAAATAVAEIA